MVGGMVLLSSCSNTSTSAGLGPDQVCPQVNTALGTLDNIENDNKTGFTAAADTLNTLASQSNGQLQPQVNALVSALNKLAATTNDGQAEGGAIALKSAVTTITNTCTAAGYTIDPYTLTS